MFSIWVNQRKRKEEINPSQSSLWDPKPEREEHLFSTQLISQEKNPATEINPAMEINHFEESEPEWLVPKETPFFAFGRGQDFLKGREGNNLLVYACRTNSLFLFLFLFSFFLCFPIFLLSFLFLLFFLLFFVSISWFLSFQSYPLPPRRCCCYCIQQELFCIVPTITGFYYFSP